MTNSPVMGITEEILGEIERAGWKLVPAKPTTDMCNAAAEATGYDDYHGAYVGYIAMLAAAPEYTTQEGHSHE